MFLDRLVDRLKHAFCQALLFSDDFIESFQQTASPSLSSTGFSIAKLRRTCASCVLRCGASSSAIRCLRTAAGAGKPTTASAGVGAAENQAPAAAKGVCFNFAKESACAGTRFTSSTSRRVRRVHQQHAVTSARASARTATCSNSSTTKKTKRGIGPCLRANAQIQTGHRSVPSGELV